MNWGMLSRRSATPPTTTPPPSPSSPQYSPDGRGLRAVRAARPEHLDLPYAAGERTKWDLFPAAEAGAPCFVHVHGGYWQRNNREMFACMAEGVAAHGWSVRVAGLHADARRLADPDRRRAAAGARLAGRSRRERGIAGPLMLSGWSAGGHLGGAPARPSQHRRRLRHLRRLRARPHPRHLPQREGAPDRRGDRRAVAAATAAIGQAPDDHVRHARTRCAGQLEPRLHAKRAAAHLPGDLVPATGHDHFSIMETLRSPTGLLTKCMLRLAEDL